ncbi:ComEA family DNA-binding protein [Pseudomonas fontis]|uniref:ComEA family DNA-binding protein n=1 Tax=Pseudomonas fontis TaxID=2942633 RepID=A0ABT5NVG1_9PSED|nr:ComEA family DNA-binding protein [Pseudomonas fontis]MDD0975532.1 ComEA family DNA-binding protein [Pseudomonas fontis]MDD0992176.1 ComEA family DNA-binding protein [Pseudomonas fontis]
MRHTYLASLLMALVTTFSLSAGAVPASPPVTVLAPVSVTAAQAIDKLDLNTADATTLQRELNGVGKSKSEAIVAYREANGNFATVDELLEVKGIGKSILERNRDKVTVNN